MKKTLLTALFALLITILPTAVDAQSKNSQVLPIKRVVLYSNGVAYVERRGLVSGNAKIDLSFKQSQIDDVLKSMIVLDLGKGRIGAVSYNSSAPTSARLAEIPFSVMPKTDGSSGNGGIAGVLSQMQGANVSVTSKGVTTRGAVLNVERLEIESEKDPKVINTLVIATPNGTIRSFDLTAISGVTLLDETTKDDISEFAEAAASSRRKDAKTISVTSEGAGRRELMVSYTIASPIWKTTYRVVMDKEGKPFFQGWAIVDNVSDEDWNNVSLSLVSGSPVSFIQELQRPFYKYRPVVPLPTDVNVRPQTYEETGVVDAKQEMKNRVVGGVVSGTRSSSSIVRLDDSQISSNVIRDGIDVEEVSNQPTPASSLIRSGSSGVVADTSGEDIGDLFKYNIDRPMTVKRNRSALIPIVQTEMDGERVSIFNESVSRKRPLSGMRLVNTSNLTFESGSLTVIDGDSYAGEALIRRLKPKESRFISFAVDLGTLARVESKGDRQRASLVKAFDGVLQIHYFRTEKKTYKFSNQSTNAKVIYVEHPIRNGWKLSETTQKPDITTQVFHRFKIELAPLSEGEISVEEVRPRIDSFRLTDIRRRQIQLFVSRNYIDAETQKKLNDLIDIKTKIADIGRKQNNLKAERTQISNDQKRIRENIEALSKTPEAKSLINRYIQKADQQESRLETIVVEERRLDTEKAELNRQLSAAIRGFELEKPIE